MIRTTSAAGRAALMAREGCRLEAYRDSVGVPTIGVGHTGRASPPMVAMGMTISRAEADAIFAGDLAPFEAAVDRATPASTGTNQFDACVSLAFNIGVRGFIGSTVVHKLVAGDVSGAADAFLMWEHPPELRQRREAERAQFLRSDADDQPKAPALIRRPVAGPHLLPAQPPLGFWARITAFLDRKDP